MILFNFNFRGYFKRSKDIIFIFLGALILRIVFLVIMKLNAGTEFEKFVLTGDAFSYYHLAYNLKYFFSLAILDTPFFSDAFLRTPGYPLFLRFIFLFNKSLAFVMVVQAFLSAFSAVLIYKISRHLEFKNFVSVGAATFFALDPIIITFSNSILTESLFIFLFLSAIYILVKTLKSKSHILRNFLFVGFLVGFGILVRPVLYPLLLIIVPFFTFVIFKLVDLRKGLLAGAIFIIGAFSFVFPWILRNKIVFNSWEVSSIGSAHLYLSYAVPFYAYKNGITNKDLAEKELNEKLNLKLVGDKYDLRNKDVLQRSAFKVIGKDPVGYFYFHAVNSIPFFIGNGYRNIPRELGFSFEKPELNYSFIRLFLLGKLDSLVKFFKEHFMYFIVFTLGGVLWLLVNIFLVLGALFTFWQKNDPVRKYMAMFFVLIILYFSFSAGPEAYYKMRFPANPLIFILAFYGLDLFLNSNFVKKFKRQPFL